VFLLCRGVIDQVEFVIKEGLFKACGSRKWTRWLIFGVVLAVRLLLTRVIAGPILVPLLSGRSRCTVLPGALAQLLDRPTT
jgi:hypothetical protein